MKATLAALAVVASIAAPAHADVAFKSGNEKEGGLVLLDESSSWCYEWAKERGYDSALAGAALPPKATNPKELFARVCWTFRESTGDFIVQAINTSGYPIKGTESFIPSDEFDISTPIGRDFYTARERFPR